MSNLLQTINDSEFSELFHDFDPSSISVERFLLRYINSPENTGKNLIDLYELFCSKLPEDMKKPSPNVWIYYYTMLAHANVLNNRTVFYNDTLLKLRVAEQSGSDPEEISFLRKLLRQHEDSMLKFAAPMLKYSNDAINRETPKQIEHTHKTKLSLSDIHQIMENNIIPVIQSD